MSTRLIARIRARLRNGRGDAGITLAEVVVTMAISTLLGAMTLAMFLAINTSTAATTDRTVNTASSRVAIQSWAAYLRVADGTTAGSRSNRVEWLTGNDMLFYADLSNRSMSSVGTTSAPVMIWLRRDASNNLVEEQFPSTATSGTHPSICRTLVRSVSTYVDQFNTQHPLFEAADYSENSLSSFDLGTAPTASSGCTNLPVTVPSRQSKPDATAQANLQNVYSVTISFTVSDTKGQHPLAFLSTAFLPSLGGT